MKEKINTPEESINIINKMMQLTRGSVKEAWWYFLLFGILVIVASILHYGALKFNYPRGGYVWVIMGIGGLIAVIKSTRQKSNNNPQNTIYGFIWLSAGISYLVILIGMAKISCNATLLINPLVFSIAAGATFLTGQITKFRPLIFGGLFMWLISLTQLFVAPDVQLLLNIVAVAGGYLLPAYLLKQSEEL